MRARHSRSAEIRGTTRVGTCSAIRSGATATPPSRGVRGSPTVSTLNPIPVVPASDPEDPADLADPVDPADPADPARGSAVFQAVFHDAPVGSVVSMAIRFIPSATF